MTMTAKQWQPGVMVRAGFFYTHKNRTYRAKYGHLALESHPPDTYPDLYQQAKETP